MSHHGGGGGGEEEGGVGDKKEESKTDCRVSTLSTANPLGGAEASSVWIKAQHSCVGGFIWLL